MESARYLTLAISVLSIFGLSACSLNANIKSLGENSLSIKPISDDLDSVKDELPKLSFSAAGPAVEENAGTITLTIQSNKTLTSNINFTLNISGSASNGADYSVQAPGTNITMSVGTSSVQVKIDIVDDAAQEVIEFIDLALPSSTQFDLGTTSQVQISINTSDVPVCDTGITNNFGGGAGSTINPYRICNLDQWAYFSSTSASWSQNVQLESDLDFTGYTFAQLKLIGTTTTKFTGVFDGNNYAIKNINVDAASSTFGLFSYTNGNATIKNLKLQSITYTSTTKSALLVHEHGTGGTLTLQNLTMTSVTSSSSNSGLVFYSYGPIVVNTLAVNGFTTRISDATAMVIGQLEANGTFSNITATSVTMNVGSTANYFAGIAGVIAPTSGLINITFSNISIDMLLGNGGTSYYMGGLLGLAYASVITIDNAKSSGTYNGRMAGGLVGQVSRLSSPVGTKITIQNSSFNGTMSLGSGVGGGLVGINSFETCEVVKSFSKGSITATTGSISGLVGQDGCVTSKIEDSYSHANISTTNATSGAAGGLVATLNGTGLTISRSYHLGTVTGNNVKGCILATLSGGTITANDVYFNSTVCASNAVNSAGYTGVTGLNTVSFQSATPFTNWLTSVWVFASGANPKLIWEP